MKILIGIIIWIACGMSGAILATKVNDIKKPMYLGAFMSFTIGGPLSLAASSIVYLIERSPCVLDCKGK